MAHTLIVKGNVGEVTRALNDRGVGFFQITAHPKFNECIVQSNADVEWSKLAAWFCEQRTCAPVTGFSPGTLLWYGPRVERTN